jgi:hypothetical protein
MTREQYWEDMVAKFQATTLSQAAFCLEQDIRCHNFRYWLAKTTLWSLIMFVLNSDHRYEYYTKACDMRKCFDSLSA